MEFKPEEVAKHNTRSDAYVIFEGKVLNVTDFLKKHPGGDEVILPYLGTDITEPFYKEHPHSKAAIRMANKLQVGTQTKEVVDPKQGMLWQIWKNFDKKSYIDFVNNPKHVDGHFRVFDTEFLEFFSKNPWQVVPIVWGPVVLYYFLASAVHLGYSSALLGLALGVFAWTLLEYVIHRFIFHTEESLPDHPLFLCFHFLIHGIHHAFPMDSLRLVFPPVFSFVLSLIVKGGINLLIPSAWGDSLFAGIVFAYIWYDCFHYYIHHGAPGIGYFKFMKSYHTQHHYTQNMNGYGVSNHFWDIVFGTKLALEEKQTNIE